MLKFSEKFMYYSMSNGKSILIGLPLDTTSFNVRNDIYEDVEIMIENGVVRLEGKLLRLGKDLHYVSILNENYTTIKIAKEKDLIFNNDDILSSKSFFNIGKPIEYLKNGAYRKIRNENDENERISIIFSNFEYTPSKNNNDQYI